VKHLPIYNSDFEKLLCDFNREVGTKGYSRAEMFGSTVREFLNFMETKGNTDIQKIKGADIVAYYEYIRERPNHRREGGLSESMIRHHLFSLRLFFEYLLDAGEIKSSPARLPRFAVGKYGQRSVPTSEEMKLIAHACETKRDHALIAVAYGCGLRRSEMEMLDVGDVLFHKGILIVREGKFGKSRTVPLSNGVMEKLKEYVIYGRTKYFPANSSNTTAAFFVNNVGTRMMGEYLNLRLKEIILKTKNQKLIAKKITLHCLRHGFATHLLDNGANIEFVQGLMGHSQIDTVHIYSKKRKQQLHVKNQFDRFYAT